MATSSDVTRPREREKWRDLEAPALSPEGSSPTERRRMDEAGGPGIGAGHERRSATLGPPCLGGATAWGQSAGRTKDQPAGVVRALKLAEGTGF